MMLSADKRWTPRERPCPCCKGLTMWTYEDFNGSTLFVRSCVDPECGYRTWHTLSVVGS